MNYISKWRKCRDVIEGEDNVKSQGKMYLPMPSGMTEEEYKSYVLRAQFFNASGRTLDGLCGLMFRKPVFIAADDGLLPYLDNVDGKGNSLSVFVSKCVRDVMITNWGGVLVDMPPSESIISQRDFENKGLYSYMTFYRAEDIINWRWQSDGRGTKLRYVIFKEDTEVDTAEYTTETKTYYRVCEIDETGYYRQRLYNDNLEILSETYPSGRNGKFREIPFRFLAANTSPDEPMLIDLINVNLSHYRKSADLENGAHWTGVPTPYASGAEPETEFIDGKEVVKPLRLGGSQVIYLQNGGDLRYLEFSGQGCNLLRDMMSDDEERMAILGARIISAEKKGVEAAETARIHRAGENSVLAEFANCISSVFSSLLKIYLEWSIGKEVNDVEVTVNTDYDVSTLQSSELSALVSAWQSGAIARSDLFYNLKEGERLDPNRTFEDMLAEIDEETGAAENPSVKQKQEQL